MSSQNGTMPKYRSRFHVSVHGPLGGSLYKSGIQRSEAILRHDDFSGSLEIAGFLVDGQPHLRIRAVEILNQSSSGSTVRTRERVLYEGPLCNVSGRSDDPAGEICSDCGGLGWAIFNDNEPETLGNIQCCDCGALPNDESAWIAAAKAGYQVDANGYVL